MGNRQPPITNPEASKDEHNSATARSEDNSVTVTASLPKAVGNNNKDAISKPTKRGTGKKIIYSLKVTLRCTEDGSKREQELGLTWVPETVADLQDEIQEQFNIPVFDQKLKFGPTALSSKESIQSYSLRNGDSITVEYTSEADVAVMLETVVYLQKTLAFIESIEPQLLLFPISTELQTSLRTEIDAMQLDMFSNAFRSTKSPKRQIADSLLFINAGGLNLLQQLHSAILRLPFKVIPLQVQVLEFGMCQMLWTLSSNTETEAAVLKELKLDNIVRSLFRVTLVPNSTIMPPPNPYTARLGDVPMQVVNNLIITSTGCLSW